MRVDTGNKMHETLLHSLRFDQADHYSLPLIKQFYKKNGMRPQAPKGDLIFTAHHNSTLLAALRLQAVDNVFLLRSMCVAQEYRQQGVGSALLQFIQPELLNIDCYCFPYDHLIDFYQSAGFKQVTPESTPASISDKYTGYIKKQPKLALMKHQ